MWPRGTTGLPVVQMNPGEARPPRRPAHRAPPSLPSPRIQPALGRRPLPRLLSPDAAEPSRPQTLPRWAGPHPPRDSAWLRMRPAASGRQHGSPRPAQPRSPGRKHSGLNLRKPRLRPFSGPLHPTLPVSFPSQAAGLSPARQAECFVFLIFDIYTHC